MNQSASLIQDVSPPLDSTLCHELIEEFASLERRYVLGDWEPATLDAGQFSEAAARILYHADSGNLSTTKSVDKCLKYVEDPSNQNSHNYPERKSALHSSKVLRMMYKFRSDRGAIHIDKNYSANQLDAKLVVEGARWMLSELLRIFWTGNRKEVARIIRGLVQFEAPVIGEFDDVLLVQRTDCTAEEEILVLLYHAGEEGLSRRQLGEFAGVSASSVTNALKRLESKIVREVIKLASKNYRLTDLGIKRVMEDLAEKLTLKCS